MGSLMQYLVVTVSLVNRPFVGPEQREIHNCDSITYRLLYGKSRETFSAFRFSGCWVSGFWGGSSNRIDGKELSDVMLMTV